jgi:4-alpha-glucanotransferase
MNVPSVSDGNWAWRYSPGALRTELAQKLAALAEVTDRSSHPGWGGDGEDFAA